LLKIAFLIAKSFNPQISYAELRFPKRGYLQAKQDFLPAKSSQQKQHFSNF